MEKVIIKTCVKKETQKGVFYTIELSDGRKGISSDDLSQKIGIEIELDVRDGKEYEGQKQYYFNIPKQAGQSGGKFTQKDWTFNKRESSLKFAIESIKLTEQKVTSVNILALAKEYFTYLNEK